MGIYWYRPVPNRPYRYGVPVIRYRYQYSSLSELSTRLSMVQTGSVQFFTDAHP